MAHRPIISLLLTGITLVCGVFHGLRPGLFFYDGREKENLQIGYSINERSQVSIYIFCDGHLALKDPITRNLTRIGMDYFQVVGLKGEPQSWYAEIEENCPRYKLAIPTGLNFITLYPTNVIFISFFMKMKTLKMSYDKLYAGVYEHRDRADGFAITANITVATTSSSSSLSVDFRVECLRDGQTHNVIPFGPFPLKAGRNGDPSTVSYPDGEVMKIYDDIHAKCANIGGPHPGDLLDVGAGTPNTVYVKVASASLPLSRIA
ncbi:hypothetical protein FOL47_000620 [Perkinsus chesapeaki]|uniref:Uncharacterized protein n=1 Tax=Perkinsus chesapeaki TaxID=330153 RepID=A0A7J6MLA0_PERCH|nr:hypothetical protein FOL47_000620 [Perkinsus chesapeaki]